MYVERNLRIFYCITTSKVQRSHFSKCGLYLLVMQGFSGPLSASKNCPHFFVHNIMSREIFIGPIIKQKLDESPYTVALFAREIGRSRKSAYILFKAKSIDTDLLYQISKLLHYDFFKLYMNDSEYENNAKY